MAADVGLVLHQLLPTRLKPASRPQDRSPEEKLCNRNGRCRASTSSCASGCRGDVSPFYDLTSPNAEEGGRFHARRQKNRRAAEGGGLGRSRAGSRPRPAVDRRRSAPAAGAATTPANALSAGRWSRSFVSAWSSAPGRCLTTHRVVWGDPLLSASWETVSSWQAGGGFPHGETGRAVSHNDRPQTAFPPNADFSVALQSPSLRFR